MLDLVDVAFLNNTCGCFCPAGYTSDNVSETCTACPRGTYQNESRCVTPSKCLGNRASCTVASQLQP
eukprot:1347887-Rhodomonas_salina.1